LIVSRSLGPGVFRGAGNGGSSSLWAEDEPPASSVAGQPPPGSPPLSGWVVSTVSRRAAPALPESGEGEGERPSGLVLARWSQISCSIPTFCYLVTDSTKSNADAVSRSLDLWK